MNFLPMRRQVKDPQVPIKWAGSIGARAGNHREDRGVLHIIHRLHVFDAYEYIDLIRTRIECALRYVDPESMRAGGDHVWIELGIGGC